MFAKQLTAYLIVLLCGLSAIAAGTDDDSGCSPVKKEYIGEKSQVLVEEKNCGGTVNPLVESKMVDSGKSKTKGNSVNVCGAECDTVCYKKNKPAYYLPSDCQVIYNAIWYESQRNVEGQHFNITTDHSVSMSYATCKVSFVNNEKDTALEYCRNDWGAVIKYIATSGTCPYGGKCVAKDKNGPQWAIRAIESQAILLRP
ncbi:hypothetical protein MPER_10349 [Moniliophthora perniciosa FA553]|nr:hypothetical protein MPER_10349 [Moniliophthora perniciosa FA553]